YDPFLRRNTFRAGAWTRTWYLEGVREYAGTLGFGMPLGKRGAMLDLGLYVGSRDFDAPLEGSEVFWGVRLGLTGIGEWGKDSHKRR
ncbi:MAG TPA: hypothetical protein VLM37_01095, partial [Fibrobacteraceae bacterium]|nr:hypothetical protein [Fibrobacteraceae bacterium]